MAYQINPKFVSPTGTAVYPKLNEPDTKFKTEGEYAVKLAFEPDDAAFAKLLKKLETIQAEQFKEFQKENPKQKQYKLAPVATAELDEDGEETGRLLLNCKTKASGVSKRTGKRWSHKVAIFDAAGVKLENAPLIWGGSKLKVAFEAAGFGVPSAKLFYLTLRMNGVQVIELVTSGGESAESLGFGEEDGYVADDSTVHKAIGTDDDAPCVTDDDADNDGDF